MWILKNSNNLLEYIQSRFLSTFNSIKTVDCSTLYTTIPYSKLKDSLMGLVQLCFTEKKGQRRCKYLVLGRDTSYFVKANTLILPTSYLKLIASTYSCLWLATYLLCLVDVSYNRQVVYLWIQFVLLFSPTCFCIPMRETSYRGFSRKTKKASPILEIDVPLYTWIPFIKSV